MRTTASQAVPRPEQDSRDSAGESNAVWRDGVPFAPTDEVLAGVEQLLVRDAELLRRLAE